MDTKNRFHALKTLRKGMTWKCRPQIIPQELNYDLCIILPNHRTLKHHRTLWFKQMDEFPSTVLMIVIKSVHVHV